MNAMQEQPTDILSLSKASLMHLLKVISRQPILVILENLLVKSGQIIASDLENTLILKTDYAGESFLINGGMLKKALATVKTKEVDLFQLIQKFGGLRLQDDVGEFPDLPEFKSVIQTIQVDLTHANRHKYCRSKDELRPAMTGLALTPNGLCMTDVHKLYWDTSQKAGFKGVKEENSNKYIKDPFDVIIPAKAQDLAADCFELTYNKTHAFLNWEGWQLYTRLIDARYPQFLDVIPTHNPITVEFDRKHLLALVQEGLVCGNNVTHQVKLDLVNFRISTFDIDFNTAYDQPLIPVNKTQSSLIKGEVVNDVLQPDTIDCEWKGIVIGLNGKFLTDILKGLTEDIVTVEMSVPNRAVIFNKSVLLMPVMTSKENV